MARVVIVAPEDLPIPPSRGGSVQIYLDGLVRNLQKTGTSVTLISPGTREPKGFPVLHVHGPKKLYQHKVLRILAQLAPDIVQVDNRPELVQKVKHALPGVKVILNLHSNTFLSSSYIAPHRARKNLIAADAVVLNSKYLRNWIRNRFALGASSWNPVVIYPGIDLHKFANNNSISHANADTLPKDRQSLRILFVGRVIRQKGAHVLISAAKYLTKDLHIPVKVTLVGRTPPWEKAYGEKIRASLKGWPMRWVGFVSPAQLPRYYWNADVLVCPSQWREAFGLVNVEAMAAGLPVIASNVGGLQEVVDSTSGLLVTNYHNPQGFARALQQLATNPLLREQLSRGAAKRAHQFAWERAARSFQALYAQWP